MLEYIYLILIGFIAGMINIVAGGGSLLTLPILIFLGLPPNVANGTNRIAIIIQNIFAVKAFHSKGVTTFPFSIYVAIPALIGSLIGAQFAVDIKGETFNRILSIVMLLIVLYLIFKPKVNVLESAERKSGKHLWLSIVAFFFVGLYGGFIQAGVGFLMIALLTGINQISLVKTNAIKVFVALIYLIGSVVIFSSHNSISWKHGLILAIGNASGGLIMTKLSIKKGDGFVKILIIIAILVMAVKLWFF